MSNSVLNINPALDEFFRYVEERRDDIENVIAFIETKDGYVTSVTTGFDANFLLYAKRQLERQLDHVVDSHYGEEE